MFSCFRKFRYFLTVAIFSPPFASSTQAADDNKCRNKNDERNNRPDDAVSNVTVLPQVHLVLDVARHKHQVPYLHLRKTLNKIVSMPLL